MLQWDAEVWWLESSVSSDALSFAYLIPTLFPVLAGPVWLGAGSQSANTALGGVAEEESNLFPHSTKWSEFLAEEGRLVLYLACRIISRDPLTCHKDGSLLC